MKKAKVWKNVREMRELNNRSDHLEEKMKYVREKYKIMTGENVPVDEPLSLNDLSSSQVSVEELPSNEELAQKLASLGAELVSCYQMSSNMR